MKGDLSRSTFHPRKHYSSVRLQQGRVQVDADWNEQADITSHRIEMEAADLIGGCGGPLHNAAFHFVASADQLTDEEKKLPGNQNPPAPQGSEFLISAGHYYVDGVLCQNDQIVALTGQEDLPGLQADASGMTLTPELQGLGVEGFDLPVPSGPYLAYLDVWRRHITALEDRRISEIALGGPDTCTRAKTVWQVKLLRADNANATCLSDLAAWNKVVAGSSGWLKARTNPQQQAPDPCIVPASAGYRRLENQLYRVEIHLGGVANVATFKWSRENGSIVTAWQDKQGDNLVVESSGRDKVLNFSAGNWVELSDDTRDLWGLPGTLVQLDKVDGQTLTIKPATATGAVERDKFPRNPKVRRWEQQDSVAAALQNGAMIVKEDQWIDLEDGVQVFFQKGGSYRTGDYWTIPARTALGELGGDIEWPTDVSNNPLFKAPDGIRHHYCRLALLNFDGGTKKFNLPPTQDCRRLFPPVSEMTNLLYVGGDGQEAMPGEALPMALQVRVENGQIPVVGATAQFEIEAGGGALLDPPAVTTVGPDGIAQCRWRVGSAGTQQIKVALLDAAGNPVPGQVLRFTANVSLASRVAYEPDPTKCSILANVATVQDALNKLCQVSGGGCEVTVGKGGQITQLNQETLGTLLKQNTDLCLCLMAGDHELPGLEFVEKQPGRSIKLKITGCGPGTRVALQKPVRFTGLGAFTMRDLVIDAAPNIADGIVGALSFTRCKQVALQSCAVFGLSEKGPLLAISGAERTLLSATAFEAWSRPALEIPVGVFKRVELQFPLMEKLYSVRERREFEQQVIKAADALVALPPADRIRFGKKLLSVVTDAMQPVLGSAGLSSYLSLGTGLIAETIDPVILTDFLRTIRATAIRQQPSLAIVLSAVSPEFPGALRQFLEDAEAYTLLEDNRVAGILSFAGLPGNVSLTTDELKKLKVALTQGNAQVRILGTMGLLVMRGNRITQMSVAGSMIEEIKKVLAQNPPAGVVAATFGSCLLSNNVIEHAPSQIIAQHVSLDVTDFTLSARPPGAPAPAPPTIPLGVAIADSAVFIGNRARRQAPSVGGVAAPAQFIEVTRVADKAANVDIAIPSA